VQYIAARDLAAALGAKLKPGEKRLVTLSRGKDGTRKALSLVYTPGLAAATAGGAAKTWTHPPFEQNGRGYLPLQETCSLLGYEADYDEGTNVLTLVSK